MVGPSDKSEIAEYKEFKNKEFYFSYPVFKGWENVIYTAKDTSFIPKGDVGSDKNIISPRFEVKRISQGLYDECGECMLVGYTDKIKTNPNGVKYASMRVLGNVKDWSGYEFYKEHGWSVSIRLWPNNAKGFSVDLFFKKVIETFKFL